MWICKHCEYTHWDFTPSQPPLPEAALPKLGATPLVSNFGPFSAKSILMPVVLLIHSLDCAKEPEKNLMICSIIVIYIIMLILL